MSTSLLAVTLWVPLGLLFGLFVLGAIAYVSISSVREEKKQEQQKKNHRHGTSGE